MGRPQKMAKSIIAIDPGSEKSAFVIWDGSTIITAKIVPNEEMLTLLEWHSGWNMAKDKIVCLVIEKVQCYGMPVGETIFDTVFWSGRFVQVWGEKWEAVPRGEVKLHICHNSRAKDSNIRCALIDRFGGSRDKAIGKKASPGPLYGIKSHLWAALALGLYWYDTN